MSSHNLLGGLRGLSSAVMLGVKSTLSFSAGAEPLRATKHPEHPDT